MKVKGREQAILSDDIEKLTKLGLILVNLGENRGGDRRHASQNHLLSTYYKPSIVLFNLHYSPLRSGRNIINIVTLILQVTLLRHRKTLTSHTISLQQFQNNSALPNS